VYNQCDLVTDDGRHAQYAHQLKRWGVRKINGSVVLGQSRRTSDDSLSSVSTTIDLGTPSTTTATSSSNAVIPKPPLARQASNEDIFSSSEDSTLLQGLFFEPELSLALDRDRIRHLDSTAKMSAAELFFHIGLHSEACHLYEQAVNEANGFLPTSPKLFLALADRSIDFLDKWIEQGFIEVDDHEKLNFVEYGRPSSQIVRLLHCVLRMELYSRLEDWEPEDLSLVSEAISHLSETDRRLNFLVYQSAVQLLRNRRIPPKVQSIDDHHTTELLQENTCFPKHSIQHLNQVFLEVRHGAFELKDGVLQNNCLPSCLEWCQAKSQDYSIFWIAASPLYHTWASMEGDELHWFCYFWGRWHEDQAEKALNPWERMGLKPADLLKTICELIFSAGSDPSRRISCQLLSAEVSRSIGMLLGKPAAELARDFLKAFTSRNEVFDQQQGKYEWQDRSRLELGSRLIQKYLQSPAIPSQNAANTSVPIPDNTIVDAGDSNLQTSVGLPMTLASSRHSSMSSMASMRRIRDRIGCRSNPSSFASQVSTISGRLSIMSIK
jgi:hypothetical protein